MKFLYKAFRYWNIPKVVTIELLLLLLLISATFAFLPSKPPSSVGYEYTGKSFPTATHHASSMGLLFFQSRDVLDYTDIPWYTRKRCFLAANRVDDIDSNGSGSITRSTGTSSSSSEPPVNGSGSAKFVYYQVYVDKTTLSQVTKVKVDIEDEVDVDSIKDAIKTRSSPEFDSVPIQRIELFESEEDIEQEKPPLDARMEWNPNVTWGTKTQPLIVQVPVKRISESPRSNNNGEC